MLASDIIFLLQWWIWLLALGIISLPITCLIFPKFFDKGYIFSKIIGVIIISYVTFVLGTLHLLVFTHQTILLSILLFGFVTIAFIARPLHISSILKNKWKIFLFEELLFIICLIFWAYVRGNQPDIHGLEKYMDFGFINSILRSTYFPPADMWYTPFSINYYYFGHLVTAVLTRLTNIPASITFNFMLATIFGFCFTCVYSLSANLFHKKFTRQFLVYLTAFIAGLLITFAGNLQTIYTLFKPYQNDNPVPFWKLPFLPFSFPNVYWYPNATRFIYHTIHEFPIYSFVVSDLHGHVLDIPFVLLTIAVLFSFLLSVHNIWRLSLWHGLFIGFLLAILYMTNAWDGPIYFLLAVGIISYIEKQRVYHAEEHPLLRLPMQNDQLKKYFIKHTTTNWLTGTLFYLFIVGISYLFFSLPFSLFFSASSIAHGIGILCAPAFLTKIGNIGPFLFEPNHCDHSPLWQLFLLYGFFYFWVISFLVLLWKFRKQKPVTLPDIFILLLSGLATLLIIIPEFVYLKDIYPTYYRANTMFKLVYQSFMILSIVSGYSIVRILQYTKHLTTLRARILSVFYWIVAIGLCTLVAIYPYFAITSYYGNLQTYYGLDGTKYLEKIYPTDYDAINWLNTHIAGQPVILEAQGDSYTDYARISTNTGLPTVLGWTVHEWLWRGSYDPLPQRINDIQTMYESTDMLLTKQLVNKYHISLVFIGALEKQKYPNLHEEKFTTLGKLIYANGTTKIYQIK